MTFSPIKHLVCSKSTFQPRKVWVSVCLEVSSVFFFSAFMQFYECVHDFWTSPPPVTLDLLWPSLSPFEPNCTTWRWLRLQIAPKSALSMGTPSTTVPLSREPRGIPSNGLRWDAHGPINLHSDTFNSHQGRCSFSSATAALTVLTVPTSRPSRFFNAGPLQQQQQLSFFDRQPLYRCKFRML